MRNCRNNKYRILLVATLLAMAALFVANLFWGSVHIPGKDVIEILTGGEVTRPGWKIIVLDTRLPQALTALMAGMALSSAGLMLQILFNNPLAGPEVFGINSGAGLGVAIVMLLLHGSFAAGAMSVGGYIALLAGAFVGAIFVTVIILGLSTWVKSNMFLLIAGIAISYLVSAVITLLNYFSTAEGVHSYIIWGMGNFGGVTMGLMPLFAGVLILSLLFTLFMVKPLNALSLGDTYAANLGIHIKRVRTLLLLLAGLLTATVTAFCGPISFIGLAVPHFSRLFMRTNNNLYLVPATMFIGGAVALLCNLLCQLPGKSGQIPLGALTPLIGAPVILYLVIKKRTN